LTGHVPGSAAPSASGVLRWNQIRHRVPGSESNGGVRTTLVAGDITRGALVKTDPFDNAVVLFKATGAQIRKILAHHAQ